MRVSTGGTLGGALLVLAGVFQSRTLKNVCLRHCRTPLGFILVDGERERVGGGGGGSGDRPRDWMHARGIA